MILLDTDHVTFLQWGGREAATITRRLARDGYDVPATTIISYEEHVRGWLSQISSAENMVDEVEVYARLKEQLVFYSELEVVDFDGLAATEFQRLRRLKIRVGTMDLKIATIALVHDALLLTRNALDFGKVPGLRIEDATKS